jgi:uncharacterized membrane protein
MNILLWVLQVSLGLWNLIGGVYTLSHYQQIASLWASNLPAAVWVAIAVLQILFSIALVLPKLTSIAAVYLAVNALLGCALFAQYAGFPGMLWGVVPAALCAFVVCGRMTQKASKFGKAKK